MALSNDIISQFVKITNDKTEEKKETIVYGTVVVSNSTKYVKIDGSDLLTPIMATADAQDGDRVTVMIKNHTATITGNVSSPAARSADVKGMGSDYQKLSNKIDQFEILVADKVDTEALNAVTGRIDYLVSDNTIIRQNLTAAQADIKELQSDNVTINKRLTAAEADITELKADKLDVDIANITYATIDNLDATNADVHNLESTYANFVSTTTAKLTAQDASISDLQAKKLSADTANITYAKIDDLTAATADITDLEATFSDFETTTTNKLAAQDASIANLQADKVSASAIEGKYANIDFSNVGKAAMQYFYAESGLIQDVVVGDTTITGKLVGVTISGDLIEGNTVKAEKLVIKGTDGLYYKLNTDGITTEAEQTNQNCLDGSVIKAKSITATKIAVDDLVAFGATIGGFHITNSAIYSGVKESVGNATSGLYMDKEGQLSLGDSNEYLKYYKDQNGDYHLEISAQSVLMATSSTSEDPQSQTIEDAIDELSEATTTNTNDLANYITSTNSELENLQNQIDGSITTWFYEYEPTTSNVPAKDWTTTDAKNTHLGDLFYNTLTGYCYRWQVLNNVYSWNRITDVDVTKALADAAAAQDTADKKRRVFVTTPTTPYDVGDLWAQGTSGELMRCKTTKTANQSYAAADWEKASKYTDDTAANNAKKAADAAQTDVNAVKTRMSSAETQIAQNKEAIALRATKTEVAESLSGYYTKEQADAALTVLSNSISSNVTETTNLGTRMSTVEQKAGALTVRLDNAESSITTAQSTANTALARTTVKDTREDNQTPSWYMTNYPKQTVVEFKKCTAIGLSGSTYCSLETVVPWNDKLGSYPKQTAIVNEKQYWRTGTSDTTWGSWMAASETATNFISFDTTNGVLIGNKTSGSWSGTRAQITGSALNILDSSGTVLSSYGTTTTIGKTTGNNIYIDSDSVDIRKNGKVLATFDQYGLKIANANDATGSLGSGTTKPALVIGTPTGYHIEMDNNEIMAKSNATTSSHLFLNMEGGNVSVNNNADRAFMFQEGALYAKNASYNGGNYLGIIDALNDAGNTVFGYGGYINKIGSTNIYGNGISLVSNGNIDVEASWINCRSIAPNDNATYALGIYGEKGWSNIYLGKSDNKTNALHIISGSSTYLLCGVNSSGQYVFGNNAAIMYYQAKDVGTTNTGNAFKFTSGNNAAANNTNSVWLFGAADATSRYIGSYMAYSRTYSSAANMVVTSNGIFGRSTSSSMRYKNSIVEADISELKGLYDLPIKKFKYNTDYISSDDELYDKYLYGFIVEDLENVLPCAVEHITDEAGNAIPEMWNSNVIVPSLLKLIQDLNNRLAALEKKGE